MSSNLTANQNLARCPDLLALNLMSTLLQATNQCNDFYFFAAPRNRSYGQSKMATTLERLCDLPNKTIMRWQPSNSLSESSAWVQGVAQHWVHGAHSHECSVVSLRE